VRSSHPAEHQTSRACVRVCVTMLYTAVYRSLDAVMERRPPACPSRRGRPRPVRSLPGDRWARRPTHRGGGSGPGTRRSALRPPAVLPGARWVGPDGVIELSTDAFERLRRLFTSRVASRVGRRVHDVKQTPVQPAVMLNYLRYGDSSIAHVCLCVCV